MAYRYIVRANSRLVEIDLETAVEFYDHTEASFRKQIEIFEARVQKKVKQHPKSYWDEEVSDGVTRGEIVSEQRMELLGIAALNGHFGILTVYSAFDRFLNHLFQYIKEFKMSVPPAFKRKNWLDLVGYKEVLKANGVDITVAPIRYQELIKLRDIRNAIAHDGGWVTHDNERRLRSYGYKASTQITISDECFRSSVTLVRESFERIAKLFARKLAACELRNQRLLKKSALSKAK
jgi:hypothetical protein